MQYLCLILSLIFISANAWQRTKCGPADQITKWGKTLDPNNVLKEYPRPRLARHMNTYINLNGIWEFEPSSSENEQPQFGKPLNSTILVPFPVESCLSGVGKTYKNLWYRKVVGSIFHNSAST